MTREEIRKLCHKVRRLVETLRQEAAHGESPLTYTRTHQRPMEVIYPQNW